MSASRSQRDCPHFSPPFFRACYPKTYKYFPGVTTVDRLSRKELKTDKFVQETGHIFEFLTEHPEQLKMYGAIALGVIVLAGGIYFYRNHQAAAREEALAQAMRIDNGVVNNTPVPPNLTFK